MLRDKILEIIYVDHSNNCIGAWSAGYGDSLMPKDKCFCGAFDEQEKTVDQLLALFNSNLKEQREGFYKTIKAILDKNTSEELGTADYDGIAEDVARLEIKLRAELATNTLEVKL